MPFYTQNNTQAMLWIPFSCLCDTGYFSSIASCRHGNWLWFPKISSKLALKSQFRADFRLSVASCRHGNWLCFHDPYFTVLFWWLFRISGFNSSRRPIAVARVESLRGNQRAPGSRHQVADHGLFLHFLRVALNLIKNLACNINFTTPILELKNYMQH